jgi:hypothetical protein
MLAHLSCTKGNTNKYNVCQAFLFEAAETVVKPKTKRPLRILTKLRMSISVEHAVQLKAAVLL